jgi:hypothetical protein
MTEPAFKVGDMVKVFYANTTYGAFEGQGRILAVQREAFQVEGYNAWFHPRQLELISRPKRTVKKTMFTLATMDGERAFLGCPLYDSQEEALAFGRGINRKVIGTVAIDVEVEG